MLFPPSNKWSLLFLWVINSSGFRKKEHFVISHKLSGGSSTLEPQRLRSFISFCSLILSSWLGALWLQYGACWLWASSHHLRQGGGGEELPQASVLSNHHFGIQRTNTYWTIMCVVMCQAVEFNDPLKMCIRPFSKSCRCKYETCPFSPCTCWAPHRAGSFSNPCPLSAVPLTCVSLVHSGHYLIYLYILILYI